MHAILKMLNIFFVALGIIFFLLIAGAGCVWWANPYGMFSPGVSPTSVMNMMTGKTNVKIDSVDKNPLLNEQQEAQLEGLGIDPATLPSQITPAMEACFTAKLGQERTNQIIQGSAPTPIDFFKAQSCLSL